jgi:hypothetical protein
LGNADTAPTLTENPPTKRAIRAKFLNFILFS